MLSSLNNNKSIDFSSNSMGNTNSNSFLQMIQYLQSQGNVNGLMNSITNNNSAFQNNRQNINMNMNMNFSGNYDYNKGKQDSNYYKR